MFITFNRFLETHYPSKDDWESYDWSIHLDDVEDSGKSIVEYAKEFVKVFWKQILKTAQKDSYAARVHASMSPNSLFYSKTLHILSHLKSIVEVLRHHNADDLDEHWGNIINRLLPRVQEETKKVLIELQKVQPTENELSRRVMNTDSILALHHIDNYLRTLNYKRIGAIADTIYSFNIWFDIFKKFLPPEAVKAGEEYIEEFYLKL